MDFDRVHIAPVSPDPSASQRYGSRDEQAPSDRDAREDAEARIEDRIEISERGRQTYRAHAAPPDIDFARKALSRLSSASADRAEQLHERIASGYYSSPVILEQIVARLVHTS